MNKLNGSMMVGFTEPADQFLTVYTGGRFLIGGQYETAEHAYDMRQVDVPGIVIRVARDANGDFSVEKVKEWS